MTNQGIKNMIVRCIVSPQPAFQMHRHLRVSPALCGGQAPSAFEAVEVLGIVEEELILESNHGRHTKELLHSGCGLPRTHTQVLGIQNL